MKTAKNNKTILFVLFMLFTNFQLLAQHQIRVDSQGNITNTIDLNIDWFNKTALAYEESSCVIEYDYDNAKYTFNSVAKNFNNPEINFLTEDIQFGEGCLVLDNGNKINVKYKYDKELFQVSISCYNKNGLLNTNYLKNGRITKTMNKKNSEGGLIVFRLEKNLIVAGYNASDSTFVFIR